MTTETRPRASKIGSGSQIVTSTGALLALLYTEPEDVRIQSLAARLKVTQRTVMGLTAAIIAKGWATVVSKGRENRYELTPEGYYLGSECRQVLLQEGVEL